MDQIRIDNLEVYAYHGVYEEEKKLGQTFFINAVLYTDLREAGRSDCLEYSTDYGKVCLAIRDSMTQSTYQLIEAAAEHTADTILLQFPHIIKVELEVRKPGAPIPMSFQSVSVRVERGWNKSYIAFGSNRGDREANIAGAIAELKENSYCRVGRISSVFRTTPYGMEDDGEFLNGVLELDTLLTPEELLDFLHLVEEHGGREKGSHFAPRTLDLDIILYGDIITDTKRLHIPHADMANRDFVLQPLAEIAGCVRHPLTKQTIEEMLCRLKETGEKHVL